MDDIIVKTFQKDDAAWLIARHGALYAEAEGFDDRFRVLVAQIVAAFVKGHDPVRERGWIAWRGGERVGSVFCVRATQDIAKLRLFLIEPAARGGGLAQRMLDQCMRFAQEAGYRRMTLWTHESHRAAVRLYEKNGFILKDFKPVRAFGQELVEQHWEIALEGLAIVKAGR